MLSWEFREFIDELQKKPLVNPARMGYANVRKMQDRDVTTDRVNCPGIQQEAAVINDICAEWLVPDKSPAKQMILYIHGGSWALGGIRQTRHFLAPMAACFGVKTLHFDYSLMPEHPFPAGLNDCETVYRGLLDMGWKGENIVLSGESAGANLALALLLRLKQSGVEMPAAAVMMSPITYMDSMEGSHTDMLGKDPILAEDSFVVSKVAELYAPGMDKRNPLLSPLYGELSGLPPMQLYVGTDELLLDDTLRFYQRSRDAGNAVSLVVGDHMVHSWPIFMQRFPEAEAAVHSMSAFIWEHLNAAAQNRDAFREKWLADMAVEEIERNYAHASLAAIAEKHHQTVYSYSKLIKRYTGYTFNQLLKRKRLSVVEDRLRSTELSVKTIAMEVGYENLTHFYDIFRKRFGMSPQQLRIARIAKIDNENE